MKVNAEYCCNDGEERELEDRLEQLEKKIAERDACIETLSLEVSQKGEEGYAHYLIALQFSARLEILKSSFAWKLIKPFRMLWAFFTRKLKISAVPLHQLEFQDDLWRSTGSDPQFLLVCERAWHGLSGWHQLEVDFKSEDPLEAQFFFDTGSGFSCSNFTDIQLSGGGKQKISIYIPPACQYIRFDPGNEPVRFKLALHSLTRLKKSPPRNENLLECSGNRSFQANGGGNLQLIPCSMVKKGMEGGYLWESEGEDPWFLMDSGGTNFDLGWWSIELTIKADFLAGRAKIYFDYGEGFIESDSVSIPYESEMVAERVINLRSTVSRLRLDPLDFPALFTVEKITISRLLFPEVQDRILQKLTGPNGMFSGLTLKKATKKVQKHAEKIKSSFESVLLKLYDDVLLDKGKTSLNYEFWINSFERPQSLEYEELINEQKSFNLQPRISIVFPTYNTDEAYLSSAIESVLSQSYEDWELCIADDASKKPHVKKILDKYKEKDSRIKVCFRKENGHISAASNSALELATGEYVALMDHDDELPHYALHYVVAAINASPEAKILYSDEDKIDENGARSSPHFKPDWNPDLLFSLNYVSHLGVYQRDLLGKIGGFRIGVEGSQDHDLLLRCLPYISHSEIIHIPKVLYHWRMLEGSTALASGEKSYTEMAGIKALCDHFSAQGMEEIQVENGLVPNAYRIRYPAPVPDPLVSLLIPTRDKLEYLRPCIESILAKTTYREYEIIILDNDSVEQETLDFFSRVQEQDSRIRVVSYDQPFNFSAINNFGVKHARGELIGLINNDIEVISSDWLVEMVSHAVRPEIGCVGAKLYFGDDTIQHAGVVLGIGGVAGHSHRGYPRWSSGYFSRLKTIQSVSAVTAACLLVRKEIYEEVGGLEEKGLRVAFNDVDFCLKVRDAGYRNLWTPYAELYHLESKSRGAEDTPGKIARFNEEIKFMQDKWGDKLQCDPYYNPNLTHTGENFSLRFK